jgi:ATP synthase protein I
VSKAVLNVSRATVKRWLMIQLIIICIITVLSFLINVEFATAIFLGGMICFIPNVIFARSWLSFFSARYPGQMLMMFYFGEVIKFSLIVVLFILTFKFLAIAPLPTLIGFVVAQVGLFIGPMFKSKI